jgi:predicted metal-dependent peptidase
LHAQLKKSINHLIFQEPFIGSLLPRLKIIQDSENTETMATDGKVIFWNGKYLDTLNIYEIRGMTAHEIFHCILLHMYRRGTRDFNKWNYACDFAINPFIEQLNGCILWEGALIDLKRFPIGMTAEKIYDLLNDNEIPKDFKCDVIETNELTKHIDEIEWKGAVSVAMKSAETAGKLSKELKQMLDIYMNPKIPWQQLLYTWMIRTTEFRPDWTKSNRHYRSQGIFLPGKRKIPTGNFILSYDVSKSMSDKAIVDSLTECRFIINEINPAYVILLEHDVRITQVRKFEKADDLPTRVQITGRGGTNFNPVFDYANDRDELPEALILFTDGKGRHPEYPPEYPVLWVMVETDPNIKMNFGEQIWLDY